MWNRPCEKWLSTCSTNRTPTSRRLPESSRICRASTIRWTDASNCSPPTRNPTTPSRSSSRSSKSSPFTDIRAFSEQYAAVWKKLNAEVEAANAEAKRKKKAQKRKQQQKQRVAREDPKPDNNESTDSADAGGNDTSFDGGRQVGSKIFRQKSEVGIPPTSGDDRLGTRGDTSISPCCIR